MKLKQHKDEIFSINVLVNFVSGRNWLRLTGPLGLNIHTDRSSESRFAEPLMNSQSLCMACGLCCDGTLFSHVDLCAEDDITRFSGLSIRAVSNEAKLALKQPCVAYTNCACSIYTDRPQACRQFQCALLRRFKANKISRADALDVIRKGITLRDDVKRQMRTVFSEDDCNFDDFTARLRSRWKNANSAEAKACISALLQSFAALWFCINKYFRGEWQR